MTHAQPIQLAYGIEPLFPCPARVPFAFPLLLPSSAFSFLFSFFCVSFSLALFTFSPTSRPNSEFFRAREHRWKENSFARGKHRLNFQSGQCRARDVSVISETCNRRLNRVSDCIKCKQKYGRQWRSKFYWCKVEEDWRSMGARG